MPLDYKECIARTNGKKLKQDNIILEINHTFLTIKVINYGNKLPRKEMTFSSGYVFRSKPVALLSSNIVH